MRSLNNLASVQVLPTIFNGDVVSAQFTGPDSLTTHWSVYARLGDGAVDHVTDFCVRDYKDPDEAETRALQHAVWLARGVPIEPMPWRTVPVRISELATERDALLRQREILSDIAFYAGGRWTKISSAVCGKLMDALNGSRGLHDKFVEWSAEFDTFWETMADDDARREDYYTEIDEFAERKLHALLVEHRLA